MPTEKNCRLYDGTGDDNGNALGIEKEDVGVSNLK